MTNDEFQATNVLNFISKSLRAKLPPTRLFFVCAIPTDKCETTETIVRTDCAHSPKQLASILRQMANFYDPKS